MFRERKVLKIVGRKECTKLVNLDESVQVKQTLGMIVPDCGFGFPQPLVLRQPNVLLSRVKTSSKTKIH